MKFNPTGSLNVSIDSSDIAEGDFVRCKNLRINQVGIAKTRDGSAKLNATAIDPAVWWLEEMDGDRYAFAGTNIYENEVSIASGLTSAQWSAMQYNAYNDPSKNIFALNGTDRKRIEGGAVYEWGIEAPTVAPTMETGAGADSGEGLTGLYSVKYTYVRKVGDAIVSESNPSPAPDNAISLVGQSLSVLVTAPTDPQVTHIRIYRTLAGGSIYYLDLEAPYPTGFDYGFAHDWEETDVYIAGTGYDFTLTDAVHLSENTHDWEELFEDREVTETVADVPSYGGNVIGTSPSTGGGTGGGAVELK